MEWSKLIAITLSNCTKLIGAKMPMKKSENGWNKHFQPWFVVIATAGSWSGRLGTFLRNIFISFSCAFRIANTVSVILDRCKYLHVLCHWLYFSISGTKLIDKSLAIELLICAPKFIYPKVQFNHLQELRDAFSHSPFRSIPVRSIFNLAHWILVAFLLSSGKIILIEFASRKRRTTSNCSLNKVSTAINAMCHFLSTQIQGTADQTVTY